MISASSGAAVAGGDSPRPSTQPRLAPALATPEHWVGLVLFPFAYVVAAALGSSVTDQPSRFATFWPPAGLLLAAFLVAPRRHVPGLVAGAAAAQLAFDAVLGHPLTSALPLAALGIGQAMLGAAVARRVAGGPPDPSTVRGILGVLAAALVAPVLSATVLTFAMSAAGAEPVRFAAWLVRWVADLLGIMVVAPVLLVWLHPGRDPFRVADTGRRFEALLLLGALSGCAWLAFGTAASPVAHEFVLIPCLAWAALRFGVGGSSAAGLVVALGAIYTTRGMGILPEHHSGLSLSISVQLYLGVILSTQLILAAAVSERERAEAHAQASEARFRDMAANVPGVLFQWVARPGGRSEFSYMSPRLEQIFGLTRAERLFELVHPDDLGPLLRSMEEATRTVSNWSFEGRFVFPSGEVRWWQGISRPASVTPDEVVFNGILIDVTERKDAEAAMRMAGLGRLAAGMAHEVNNPLAYVTANIGFVAEELRRLQAEGPPPGPVMDLPGALEALKEAADGAVRVRDVVRDLKVFSRPPEDRAERVDVRTALRSALRLAGNEIKHRARLVTDLRDVPPVDADEHRLGQVFLNLLVNAAQAIQEGHAREHEIRVVTRAGPAGEVIVEIADTGCGMSPEVRSRIFEPFFTTKAVGAGTGLGLSICHGIVQAAGGRIEVESEPGKGSLFRVVLPPSRAAAPRPCATPVPAADRRRGRILVVDDEAPVARAVARVLAPEHDVVACTSAREALERVTSGECFDLVLCDLAMPEMTGMDLEAQLASTARAGGSAPAMLFMTGGAFTPLTREFVEARRGACVEKPFDPAALRDLVARRLAPAPARLGRS